MGSVMRTEAFCQAALEIADRKMFRDEKPTKLCSPRLGTGGAFEDIFLWDTAFCGHWAKYYSTRFPLEGSLDNFYRCQTEEGFISRQIHSNGISKWSPDFPVSFAPPLLSWIELELDELGIFPGRLKKVYPHLVKLHRFNYKWQRSDGLYFTDHWGCGMDDIPRVNDPAAYFHPDGIKLTRAAILDEGERGDRFYRNMTSHGEKYFDLNRQLGWVDTTCQVAFDALNLAKIAEKFGYEKDAAEFRTEHKKLAETINRLCWDETEGFYKDYMEGSLIRHKHIGAYWSLIAEAAPQERAERLIGHLTNPETFGLPCGIPSLSADDDGFGVTEKHYWKGPVWAPTMYMTLCGLRRYGRMDLAKQIAERFYTAAYNVWEKTGTLWENYSPLQSESESKAASPDFCGWSALIPITIYREFIQE